MRVTAAFSRLLNLEGVRAKKVGFERRRVPDASPVLPLHVRSQGGAQGREPRGTADRD